MAKNNLTAQMKKILENYTDEVMHAVADALEETAKESAEELHSAGGFKDRTGRYRKGWTSTVEEHRTFMSATVHNRTSYQLTHLLEFGHAKSNGGRTKAFTHIATVNAQAEETAIRKITEAIERIK